jgi:hypothetical protein
VTVSEGFKVEVSDGKVELETVLVETVVFV